MSSSELLSLIKQALHDEAIGERIYEKAKKEASDISVKKFFEKMEKEEESHIRYLNKLYKILDREKTSKALTKEIRLNYTPTKEIFNKDFLEKIQNSKNLLIALNTSATLEKNAVAFYTKCEKLSTEDDVKNFFKSMVIWEKDHLNKILDIFENFDDSDISFKQDDFI